MSDEEICGLKCPEHGDPCSCIATPDYMKGLGTILCGFENDETIEEHRAHGVHICIADPKKPHSWTGGE